MTTDPFSSDFSGDFGGSTSGLMLAVTQASQTLVGAILNSAYTPNPFSSDFSSDFGTGATAVPATDYATFAYVQSSQTLVAAATNSGSFGALSFTDGPQTIAGSATVSYPGVSGGLHLLQGAQILSGVAASDLTVHVGTLVATQSPQTITSPAVSTSPGGGSTTSPTLGTQADFVARLNAALPGGWFQGGTPVLDGLLAGIGYIWAGIWSLLEYVAAQKRIATATDVNLDIISVDFLGQSLPRNPAETDAQYRARIQAAIFAPRATRAAVSSALATLTGVVPQIFEPTNAHDTGGWGKTQSAVNTGLGYGLAGGYGSYALPYQAFIRTALPATITLTGVEGYGSAGAVPTMVVGGYGGGSFEYSPGAAELLSASDEQICDAVNAVKPIATIMWVSVPTT